MAHLKNVNARRLIDAGVMEALTVAIPGNITKMMMSASVVDQKGRDMSGTGTITAIAKTRNGLITFALNVDNGDGGNGNSGGSGTPAALAYNISTKAPQLIETETLGQIVFSCANAGFTVPVIPEFDGQSITNSDTNAALTGQPVLTFTAGEFTADDIGKSFIFVGAGAGGVDLYGTIVAVASATEITLSVNIAVDVTTVAGAAFTYGTVFVATPMVQVNFEYYI